jgi:predicted ATPase
VEDRNPIGRHTETAWLSDAAAAGLAGRGGLVLLAGEAGVGTTQLAASGA